MPIAPSHKAQEPTAEEWAAAAEYTLTLSLPEGWEHHGNQTTELTLAIDYSGDAARIYYNDRTCIIAGLRQFELRRPARSILAGALCLVTTC